MNPKISIVIPVYNTEKYLEACVNSVMNQTFQDFEIILVDDGSTDASGEKCDLLAKRYEKTQVIHKANSGLSHTRNCGTERASGKYITYIDSDDIVDPNYLQILFSLIQKYNANMSSCELDFCKDEHRQYCMGGTDEVGVLSGMEALKKMLRDEIHNNSACGLLIESQLAKSCPFPVGRYYEDAFTTYKFFMYADRVAYTRKQLYIYYQRAGSILHRPFGVIEIDGLDAGDAVYEECRKLGKEYEEAAFVKKTNSYLNVLNKFPDIKKSNPEIYKRIFSFIKQNRMAFIKNKYVRKTEVKFLLYRLGLLDITMRIMGKK